MSRYTHVTIAGQSAVNPSIIVSFPSKLFGSHNTLQCCGLQGSWKAATLKAEKKEDNMEIHLAQML
jgi:hypothetical protein